MEKYFVSVTSPHHVGFVGFSLIKLTTNGFTTIAKSDSRIPEDIDFLPGMTEAEDINIYNYLLEFLDDDSAKLWFALEYGEA